MLKRLLLLSGIAILLNPIHHATGYGFTAMFELSHVYLPEAANYNPVGTPAFYIFIIIQQLDFFALPAFMFISGIFLTVFAVRGATGQIGWDVVRARVKAMLIPFTIWTIIFFVFFARGLPKSLDDIFDRYFYVVLLCQYYLIAPFLIRFARERWGWFLFVAAMLELGRFSLRYLPLFGVEIPGHEWLIFLTPRWVPPMLFLWFALGMVAGLHQKAFEEGVKRWKWVLLAGTILFGVLTVVEYFAIARMTNQEWMGSYFGGITRIIYSFFTLMAFVAFDNVPIPFSKFLSDLGGKTLGIYLVHSRTMYVAAVLMYRLTPSVLGNQLIYQLVLIVAGLAGPLILMELVKRSPIRRYYRYIFG